MTTFAAVLRIAGDPPRIIQGIPPSKAMTLSPFSSRVAAAAACVLALVLAGCDAAEPHPEDPGLDPQGTWSTLGQGTNGAVHAIVVDDDGNLYVGGTFTRAGGVTVNHIAKWDGSSWSALGTGMSGGGEYTRVNALALDPDGNLYAGGRFATAGGVDAQGVAMWDGSSWSALGEPPFGTSTNPVSALAIDSEGTLYVGGAWSGEPRNLARWDGSTWSGIGFLHGSRVAALAVDESDNLYVGGESMTMEGEPPASVFMWDGARWYGLTRRHEGESSPAVVLSFSLDGAGNVYASGLGSFIDGVPTHEVAVWRWNGEEWIPLGEMFPGAVLALEKDVTGRVYAGGVFTRSEGAPADFLATWNGGEWGAVGQSLSTVGVLAIAAVGAGSLYVGGTLFPPHNGIARFSW